MNADTTNNANPDDNSGDRPSVENMNSHDT
jgi:hypothetical protein